MVYCPGGSFDLRHRWDTVLCYSYTIALSGLFARGGCLKHEAKPSGLKSLPQA